MSNKKKKKKKHGKKLTKPNKAWENSECVISKRKPFLTEVLESVSVDEECTQQLFQGFKYKKNNEKRAIFLICINFTFSNRAPRPL